MKLRKNPNLEISQHKTNFFLVGLAISLLAVHLLLEWRFADELESVSLEDLQAQKVDRIQEIHIPSTTQSAPPERLKTVFENPEILVIPDKKTLGKQIEMNLNAEINEWNAPSYSVYGTGTEFEGMATSPPTNLPTPLLIEEPKEEEVFLVVEQKPEFVGGLEAFYQFVASQLVYPSTATKENIGGKVYLQFIINKDGSIQDITVMKGIGYGCDEEAVRVLKLSPNWIPGKQRGRPVKVKMSLPIYFKLIKQ